MGNKQYNINFKNLGYLCYKKTGREQRDKHNKTTSKQPPTDLKKWVSFTYYSKVVKHIRKLFKNTNVLITQKNNYILRKILAYKNKEDKIKYN